MKKHIYITGRVQGVGFRHFTRKNADKLGIKGWVKNLPDGRVEAVFQGTESEVKELIERCKDGPVSSYVKDIDVTDVDESKDHNSFEVIL
ncbi:acylphosphatase [Rhodohalobacter sp.]|uniref:acylphosphatase n=1 Tax=Rhodohalobacter sp. TaxID=1974210 RepID=UPI002ACE7A3B|nr:acylphosphatase [Rhodohalobacter sp.]MDZ7756413.1 acylphosphatase [Rhodohalobacter sp.]